MSAQSLTIMLVHGLWVTPLSWEPFRKFYGNLGYQVLAPAWPGIHGSIADMRRDPSSLDRIGLGEVVAHYAKIIRRLPGPPILMGHSYGGVVIQILIDQGLGAAGVAIDTVPPKGLLILSPATSRVLLPALAHLCRHHGTFLLSFSQFWRWYCNTLPESEARKAYAEQMIPASCRPVFQVAFANLTPGATTTVNFGNPHRSPLLFIGGGDDVIVPAAVSRKVARKHCASPCLAAFKEFPGRSHYIIAEPGWQEVADYALTWALAHARTRS